jgi:hypothetical protein
MANIAAYAEKAMLDWVLGGAAPTRPTIWSVGLSLGAPTSISGSEITTGSGYARQTLVMAAAVSPGGSATNASAMTFGPFSGAASISGIQLWDTILTLNSGNMLWYGLLATARTVGVGDSLVIASGALTISLA